MATKRHTQQNRRSIKKRQLLVCLLLFVVIFCLFFIFVLYGKSMLSFVSIQVAQFKDSPWIFIAFVSFLLVIFLAITPRIGRLAFKLLNIFVSGFEKSFNELIENNESKNDKPIVEDAELLKKHTGRLVNINNKKDYAHESKKLTFWELFLQRLRNRFLP